MQLGLLDRVKDLLLTPFAYVGNWARSLPALGAVLSGAAQVAETAGGLALDVADATHATEWLTDRWRWGVQPLTGLYANGERAGCVRAARVCSSWQAWAGRSKA